MDPTDLPLFRLAEQRLAWTDRRQQLLAQNVANANTPGYQPRDLVPFAATLAGIGQTALAMTQPGHIASPATTAQRAMVLRPAEKSINGNGISVEDQLSKVADTASMQELTLNLHHKYQAMMRLALGLAG